MPPASPQPHPRLVLIPGMGVDYRCYNAQRPAFPYIEVPSWIPPHPRESLADYAARFARQITPEPPFFLGGVSMGGMIALELARHLRPRAVFMIASCRSGRRLPARLKILEIASRTLPDFLARRLVARLATLLARLNNLPPDYERDFRRMVCETDLPFVRWAARAVLDWHFSACDQIHCPIFQLHGDADLLIPPACAAARDLIRGGRHLINATHAEQVNAWLAQRIAEVSGQPAAWAAAMNPSSPAQTG